MRRLERLVPWRRFSPRSLRGRIAIGTGALSLAVVAVTFAVTFAVGGVLLDRLAQLSASANLESFHQFLDVETRELDSYAADFASSEALYERAGDPLDRLWATEVLDGGLRARDVTASVVLVGANGLVLYSNCGPKDTATLGPIGRTPARAKGLLWLSQGLAAVAVRPVLGTDGDVPRASLVLANAVASDVQKDYRPPTGTLTVDLLPVSTSGAGGEGSTIAGFTGVTTTRDDARAVTHATILGLDGRPAAVARMTFLDPRTAIAAGVAFGGALLASLLAALLGVGYGVIVARAVRVPLDRTIAGIEEQGHRVLDGDAPDPVAVPDATFEELWRLRSVVDELLAALSMKQEELRETTQRAQHSEQAMRTMADDSPEIKLLVEDGVVVHANPAAADVFGLEPHTLVGWTVEQVIAAATIHSADGTAIERRRAFAQALKAPVIVRLAKGGVPDRWIEIVVVANAENDRRVLVSGRDVTEERRLEAVREEILSLITHDLRAPLTVINGYLDILRRPLADEARYRAIDVAKLNAEMRAALLEDLLDITRAEELLAPRVLAPVDLISLAEEVVSSLAPAAASHEVAVAKEATPVVLGEEKRIRQAMVNLVTNALKYSPEGTTVTVRIGENAGFGVFAVEDQGPGVPASDRRHVFERYRRLEATAKDKPGLGLGLYIVRVIAENHGGQVRVEDAPLRGARFVLEVPLAQPGASTQHVAS